MNAEVNAGKSFAWRIAVCAAVLGVMVGYFARDLVPSMPLPAVLAWVCGGIALIGAAVVATVVVEGTFNQWTFRNGGLDTQWLWFRQDPPGTAQLRDLPRDRQQSDQPDKLQ